MNNRERIDLLARERRLDQNQWIRLFSSYKK